jgi:hypothetical protein
MDILQYEVGKLTKDSDGLPSPRGQGIPYVLIPEGGQSSGLPDYKIIPALKKSHQGDLLHGGINLLTSIDSPVSNQVKKHYCSSHVYLTFRPLQTRYF